MRLRRNIILMYLYTILGDALFIVPVLLPYYRDQAGLGFKELLIAEAALAATVVLLEVPFGWLADVWKRKHILATGMFLMLLSSCCLILANNFSLILVSSVLYGAGLSLCSGTGSALIYEYLLSEGKERIYSKIDGKRMALTFYSLAGAGIIGGLLYPINPQLPVALTIIAMLMALVVTCMLDEPERQKKKPEHSPIKDILLTMRYALYGHTKIAFIIFFSSAIICATKILMWAQQPYYIELGISESWFGVLMAVGFVIAGLASQASHKLGGKISYNKSFTLFWLIVFTTCVIAVIKISWFGVILLALGGAAMRGIVRPRAYEAINTQVSSTRRSTMLSTQNLMISLFYIPTSAVLGIISGDWGIKGVLIGLIIWLLISGMSLSLLFIKNGKKKLVSKSI